MREGEAMKRKRRFSLRRPRVKTITERIEDAAVGIRAMHYTDETLAERYYTAAQDVENALRDGGEITALFVAREAYRAEMEARGLKIKEAILYD